MYFHVQDNNVVISKFPDEQLVYFNYSNLDFDKNSSEVIKAFYFVAINPSLNSIINKNNDDEYFLDYELRIKSKNTSWFPYINSPYSFEHSYSQYVTNDSLLLNYKYLLCKVCDETYEEIFTVLFQKKFIETLDTNKNIKINDDKTIIEIIEENLQPIELNDERQYYSFPIELGDRYSTNLKVNDIYFLKNNEKLYPTKYKNLSDMDKIAFEIFKANGTFAGYSVEELPIKKFVYLGFINKGYTSFKLHYELSGNTRDAMIKESKDYFTKDVNINTIYKPSSPNMLLTLKVEIPEGYFIEKDTINYKDFLLSDPNISSKSVIWQYKQYDAEPLVPFKFSYSKNDKIIAFRLWIITLVFLGFILLFNKFFSHNQKIISLLSFYGVNILYPLWSNIEISTKGFINIFFYSWAYLPSLVVAILEINNYRKKLKDKQSRRTASQKGKREKSHR